MSYKSAALMVLSLSTPLLASEVLIPGVYMGLGTPHAPYQGDDTRFSVGLGYEGLPGTAIGSTTWVAGAGVFDLSSDPNLAQFLQHATNGIDDGMWVSVTDTQGYQVVHRFFAEGEIFGTAPSVDLAGLPVTGMRLQALDFTDPMASIVVRWQVLGTPEPTTGMLSILVAGCLLRRRTRGLTGC